MKKMTLTIKAEVPLDESTLDVSAFRSLWEEIDGLADTARGFGEVIHFSVDELPSRIVLADTRQPTLTDHVKAAMALGGS